MRRCFFERPVEDSPPNTARSHDADESDNENDELTGINLLLEVVARNNTGLLLFSLDRFCEAVHEFASAYDVVRSSSTAADPPPHLASGALLGLTLSHTHAHLWRVRGDGGAETGTAGGVGGTDVDTLRQPTEHPIAVGQISVPPLLLVEVTAAAGGVG